MGGRYAGLCVAATVLTYRQRVRVRPDGTVVAEYPFLLPGRAVAPWFDPAPRGFYDDLKAWAKRCHEGPRLSRRLNDVRKGTA